MFRQWLHAAAITTAAFCGMSAWADVIMEEQRRKLPARKAVSKPIEVSTLRRSPISRAAA